MTGDHRRPSRLFAIVVTDRVLERSTPSIRCGPKGNFVGRYEALVGRPAAEVAAAGPYRAAQGRAPEPRKRVSARSGNGPIL